MFSLLLQPLFQRRDARLSSQDGAVERPEFVLREAVLFGPAPFLHGPSEFLFCPPKLCIGRSDLKLQKFFLRIDHALRLQAGIIDVAGVETEKILALLFDVLAGNFLHNPLIRPPRTGGEKSHLGGQGIFFSPGPLPGPKGRVNFGKEFPDDREAILFGHVASTPESLGGFSYPLGRRRSGQKKM
ncbi:MAG: hypothetical protein BSOLF_0726 [Candidatus Carbobacillus altaicus]|uniref:Uncharacterized protein n=1 Tax=Candidatus Carbonibacillus altaicus TaxID=2163959 RepID=A0A2R6Y5C3_9BACL|nr:MAG: hypothetical protein BSOLF_0726 [Candidatus Carbobacillus altaicus]